MAVKVGSFVKSTSTSTPVSQAITDIGFAPRVLLLWTAGNTTADSIDASYQMAFGATTGASNSYSVTAASQDNQADSVTSGATQAKALAIALWDDSIAAECDLTSFDADGFTLSWTTNNNSAYIINYMALAGDNLTNAKIVAWSMGTSTGDVAVTDVGFQPDCVLHFWSQRETAGISASGKLGVGIMIDAAEEGTFCFAADDNLGTTNTSRGKDTIGDYSILQTTASAGVDGRASYVSMDADGFTVNFDDALAASYLCLSLCMKGGSYHYGYASCTGNGDRSATFAPEGILFAHSVSGASDNQATAAFGIGASDGTANNAVAIYDQDNVSTTNSAAWTTTDAAIIAQNTASLCEGYVSSVGATTFYLTFTDTDTMICGFLAIALGVVTLSTGQPTMARWRGIPGMKYSGRGGW